MKQQKQPHTYLTVKDLKSPDIDSELEQPFWCKACTDHIVRGRWSLCERCKCDKKWCETCSEEGNYVVVSKGSSCTICDTRGKDFDCIGCAQIHPDSITAVGEKYTICYICTAHGWKWCPQCDKCLFNKHFKTACNKCRAETNRVVLEPIIRDQSESVTTKEQSEGVLILPKPEQVEDKPDRKKASSLQRKNPVVTFQKERRVRIRNYCSDWTVQGKVQILCMTLIVVLLLVLVIIFLLGGKIALTGRL